MSDFYRSIARHYEDIFPLSQPTAKLLSSLIPPRAKVLDVACATGVYTRYLRQEGHQLLAFDLDEAMIELAKTKDPDGDYRVLSMSDMLSLEESFDLIFCIGNSLVHLPSLLAMENVIADSRKLLKPGGKLLIQILNYDRILDQDIRQLPLIHNSEKSLFFFRFYHPKEEFLDFHTILQMPQRRIENHQMLLPLRSEDLVNFYRKAGFVDVDLYGSMNKDPYVAEQSFALVALGCAPE